MISISYLFAGHYERDNSKESVFDTGTKLQWQDSVDTKTIRKGYEESILYCEALTFGGYDDWRLPFKDEMLSIVEKKNSPTYSPTFQNIVPDEQFNRYWVASLWKGNKESSIAGCVDFNKGINNDFCFYGKDEKFFVRCVRGEQLNKNLNIKDFYEKDGSSKRAKKKLTR